MEIDRPGLQGLPQRRQLPDPPAVADRREVHRLHADPAARARARQPPPPLQKIPDGQPGAGQYLLPLENNGKTVDLDLIQNIQRLPYARPLPADPQRPRRRPRRPRPGPRRGHRPRQPGAARRPTGSSPSSPQQNQQLASLASNGDAILQPLAAQRAHITGFFHNAAIAGQATAERGTALEEGLQSSPRPSTRSA